LLFANSSKVLKATLALYFLAKPNASYGFLEATPYNSQLETLAKS